MIPEARPAWLRFRGGRGSTPSSSPGAEANVGSAFASGLFDNLSGLEPRAHPLARLRQSVGQRIARGFGISFDSAPRGRGRLGDLRDPLVQKRGLFAQRREHGHGSGFHRVVRFFDRGGELVQTSVQPGELRPRVRDEFRFLGKGEILHPLVDIPGHRRGLIPGRKGGPGFWIGRLVGGASAAREERGGEAGRDEQVVFHGTIPTPGPGRLRRLIDADRRFRAVDFARARDFRQGVVYRRQQRGQRERFFHRHLGREQPREIGFVPGHFA